MTGYFVRRGTSEDLAELVELARASFSHPWTEAQIRAELARQRQGGVLVAQARPAERGDARVCGSCTYRVVADEMEVLDVAVLPSWRRRGVASFLVSLVLRRAARAGARAAFLEVRAGNAGARALYSGLGFREAGVRRSYYREPVEDAVLMRHEGLGGHC